MKVHSRFGLWDNESPQSFRPVSTVKDLEKRFAYEDEYETR